MPPNMVAFASASRIVDEVGRDSVAHLHHHLSASNKAVKYCALVWKNGWHAASLAMSNP